MATGEAQMFLEIWEALEPEERNSFVTMRPLGDRHEMRTYYFAHVIGKGQAEEFRLYKKNIVLLTFEEHKTWDLNRSSVRDNPLWQKLFNLEEELQAELLEHRQNTMSYD